MKSILIIGYYGFSNSGDDAILASICNDIKQLGHYNLTVLSNNPEMTKKEFCVQSVHRFKAKDVQAEISKSDIIILGGGSLLQDKTSTKSLLYYLSLIGYAKFKKKKIMLYANGIGPINKPFNKLLTKWIGNKVDVITLRETYSRETLKSLGISKPAIHITADPVFNLPLRPVDVAGIWEREGINTDKPIAAVLFRDWGDTQDYAEKTAQLCDFIIETYDMTVVFIPMKYPFDLDVSRTIHDKMKNPSFLLQHKYDAPTHIEIIGAAKLVLSMRLHPLLYAAIKTIPMIGFSYDPKIDYYLKELDMFCAGNIHEYDIQIVKEKVGDILENYSDIQEHLEIKTKELRQKALKNREILAEMLQ